MVFVVSVFSVLELLFVRSVSNAMANRIARRGRQVRHHTWQIFKITFAGDERVEHGIFQQREREPHPAAVIPSSALRGRDATNL